MKEEEADMWAALHVKPETIRGEVNKNKELLDSLQTHFYVSKPFILDTELHVEGVSNVGTLNKLPKPKIKDILTGLVRYGLCGLLQPYCKDLYDGKDTDCYQCNGYQIFLAYGR